MRHLALGARTANVIDAGRRRAADFRQRVIVEGCGFARRGEGVVIAHRNIPRLNTRRRCRC
ncbi:hypothetical protein D3C80_358390 [compost metagenome]